ncbi:hypothetical protein BJ875DRAFT_158396 [Amylocarpus encephaloides]|uniref:DUF2470 domain-containing protein n=1 Tax=Amylocarpus encephaloides TaxID=45428 RepID=A0A9P7YBW2_9HELO|nr:hypothetical protein BJ875DRAFT_158396 [Amylocarpus encephaloides]
MATQDQEAKDAAMKQRIISHMNADHQESLSLYLRQYKKLSSSQAKSPTLDDISFEAMTIRTSSGKYTIPFEPPMKSWAEARTRTVDMDRDSREGLDISSFKITEFEPPKRVPHVIIFGLVVMAFTTFATKNKIVPGTFIYDTILPWFPGGPKLFFAISNTVFIPTMIIHVVEVILLDRLRLRRYGVERGSKLWWAWIVDCFIEGYGCFQRIDATIAKKKLAAEKEKH